MAAGAETRLALPRHAGGELRDRGFSEQPATANTAAATRTGRAARAAMTPRLELLRNENRAVLHREGGPTVVRSGHLEPEVVQRGHAARDVVDGVATAAVLTQHLPVLQPGRGCSATVRRSTNRRYRSSRTIFPSGPRCGEITPGAPRYPPSPFRRGCGGRDLARSPRTPARRSGCPATRRPPRPRAGHGRGRRPGRSRCAGEDAEQRRELPLDHVRPVRERDEQHPVTERQAPRPAPARVRAAHSRSIRCCSRWPESPVHALISVGRTVERRSRIPSIVRLLVCPGRTYGAALSLSFNPRPACPRWARGRA